MAAASAGRASMNIAIGNFASKVISYSSTVILARFFLQPKDFYYLVIVDLVSGVFTQIIDVGFENYYMVKIQLGGKSPTTASEIENIENITFSMRLYSNLILFTAQIVAGFFFAPPVRYLLWILALNYLIGIFGKINEVRLKKRLEFGSISKARISAEIIATGVKVLLAFLGLGVLSIASGIIVSSIIYVSIIASISKFRPTHIGIPKEDRKQVFWFAKHSWVTGTVQYIFTQADKFFLQNFFPLVKVGLYNFSSANTNGFFDGIMAPQGTLMISHVANMKDDMDKLEKLFYNMTGFLLIAFAPWMIMAIVFAPFWVVAVFSSKWAAAIIIIRIFTAYCLLRLFCVPFINNLLIMQQLKTNSMITGVWSVIIVLGLLVAGHFISDIHWYAAIFSLLSVGFVVTKSYTGTRYMGISMFRVIAGHSKTILMLIAFGGLSYAAFSLNPLGRIGNVIALITLPAVFYASIILLHRSAWAMFRERIDSMIRPGRK